MPNQGLDCGIAIYHGRSCDCFAAHPTLAKLTARITPVNRSAGILATVNAEHADQRAAIIACSFAFISR